MRFQFRLEALLKVREYARDRCRQALALALASEAEVSRRREATVESRLAVLSEIQDLQTQSRFEAQQIASRRFHALQLLADIRQLDIAREAIHQQVTDRRQELATADQAVKVLERLRETQFVEHLHAAEKLEMLGREEAWQAGRLSRSPQEGFYTESTEN